MDLEEAQQAVRDAGLGELTEQILEFLHPSIGLKPTLTPLEHLPLGASRFGGVPDWPAGTNWPAQNGRPLAFLAQIRLADFRSFFEESDGDDLDGWLYFFYDADEQPWGFDPAHRGGWRVLCCHGPLDDLERTAPPAHPAPSGFATCALRPAIEYRLPPAEIVCGTLDIEFDETQQAAFDALFELLNRPDDPHHRMYGWPDEIQGDMRLECQLASNGLYCGDSSGYEDPRAVELEPGAFEWVLLLQIDTDKKTAGWCWGDCGRIYFWIRHEDLEAGRFERAWLILQCY